MPYYLHPKDVEPIKGTAYLDRASAFTHQKTAGLQASHTITFVASEEERDAWIDREMCRFETGEYIRVPWSDRSVRGIRRSTTPDGNYIHKYTPLFLHFAHLSLSTPGYVAYTKDEEHGIRDVQTRIRPGKYLSQFFQLSQEQVIEYCGRCNAEALSLKFATDAKTIETVYTNGPDSCMRKSFNLPVHPTAVYASTFEDGRPLPDPADVAIAYFGPWNTCAHVRSYGRSVSSTVGSTEMRQHCAHCYSETVSNPDRCMARTFAKSSTAVTRTSCRTSTASDRPRWTAAGFNCVRTTITRTRHKTRMAPRATVQRTRVITAAMITSTTKTKSTRAQCIVRTVRRTVQPARVAVSQFGMMTTTYTAPITDATATRALANTIAIVSAAIGRSTLSRSGITKTAIGVAHPTISVRRALPPDALHASTATNGNTRARPCDCCDDETETEDEVTA
jgi:hypothetical protein